MNESVEKTKMTAHHNAQRAVAIVGAGLIGRGWAIVFARGGWPVKLFDVNVTALDDAREAIAAQLEMLVANELCANTNEILDNISYEADLETALQGVDYVQECGPELLEAHRSKQEH